MIGKITSHYISQKLGAGGMGTVSKAASALNHPNIATIYEIDEPYGQMFIAMEYIEGQSLQEIIVSNLTKLLKFSKVLDYATQIAEGLSKAHSKGIIHRDIKPGNILVSEDGVVKIADFGPTCHLSDSGSGGRSSHGHLVGNLEVKV